MEYIMKKQYLLSTIICVNTGLIIGCQTVLPYIDTAKPTTALKTSSGTLSVNTIVQMVYPKILNEPLAHVTPVLNDYFKSYPYQQFEPNILGFFHPSIEYKNPQGETRYLVIVEKVKINNGYIQDCRACSSTVDLFIFKKQDNHFQLVNSALNQKDIPTADGHLYFSFKHDLQKNLRPFGKNMIGSYTLATFTGAGGQEISTWYAVLLPEAGRVQVLEIGSAGNDTSSYYADRPEFASIVTSTLRVVNNQNTYYPVEVTYINQDQSKKPYKSLFMYDQAKHLYVEYEKN